MPRGVASLGDFDLDHHGDAELADGIEDLAVNIRLTSPPQWLLAELRDVELAPYPRAGETIDVLAAWHGVEPDCVLPVAGAAEAFTLVARGLRYRHPTVIHPQFTEPEAALRAAGVLPQRVLLWPEEGFWLDVGRVPDAADLVFVGNPTNPTGVLHPADEIRRLIRPGRVIVVDEAFMDAVPGESQSLLRGDLTGVLVLRSLTKTWGLAGLRVGYVLGDPTLIAALRQIQTPWAVSTPALTAIRAICSERARSETQRWQEELRGNRDVLTADLRSLGLRVVESSAPFLLVQGPAGLREKLRKCGLGVRRGDTFPGLDSEWFRVRVPEPGLRTRLVDALGKEME